MSVKRKTQKARRIKKPAGHPKKGRSGQARVSSPADKAQDRLGYLNGLPEHSTAIPKRQTAVIRLQQEHGNAAVQRLLAVANNTVQQENGPETPLAEARASFETAKTRFSAGDYSGALANFRRAYSLSQLDQRIRRDIAYNMAVCHLRLGQYEAGAGMFQEYMLFPGANREHGLNGLRQARAGQVDPNNPDPNMTLEEQRNQFIAARGKVNNGEYAPALTSLRALYALKNAASEVRRDMAFNMGLCHRGLGQTEQAITMFLEYLQFPGANRGDALRQIRIARAGNSEPAAMSLAEQQAKFNAAQQAYTNGDYARALANFKAVFTQPASPASANPSIAYNMAVCHQRMQQFDGAISLYEEYLLSPGVSAKDRKEALERIRQARMGQIGLNVEAGQAASEVEPGEEQMLFTAVVYFNTGRHRIDSLGRQTVQELAQQLIQKHNSQPARTFRIAIVGGASSRWRKAEGETEADRLNQRLSERRAESVRALLFGQQLPTADVSAGIYRGDTDASGDDVSEALSLDANDNTWTLRSVAITVWASPEQGQSR